MLLRDGTGGITVFVFILIAAGNPTCRLGRAGTTGVLLALPPEPYAASH